MHRYSQDGGEIATIAQHGHVLQPPGTPILKRKSLANLPWIVYVSCFSGHAVLRSPHPNRPE
jgi:hypothetical protein